MALKPSAHRSLERVVEADRFLDTPHPRENFAFFGHDATEEILRELYLSGRMPQACLIGGPPGIGKATLAWRLARFILANPNASKCSGTVLDGLEVPRDAPIARQVAALSHPDLFLLRRGLNPKDQQLYREIRVEDVRKAARMFRQSTSRGGYRVCIVDSTEDLNEESASALLKIVEEPPPRSLFLLVAHKPDRVLPTIRSRCHKISLKPLHGNEILQVIDALGSPWSDAPEEERRAATASAHGSIHDAIRHLGTSGARFAVVVEKLLADLPVLDWYEIHSLAEAMARPENGPDFESLLIAAYDWLDRETRQRCKVEQGAAVERPIACACAWETVADMARRTMAFNLDRRPVVLTLFAELAAAAAGSIRSHQV